MPDTIKSYSKAHSLVKEEMAKDSYKIDQDFSHEEANTIDIIFTPIGNKEFDKRAIGSLNFDHIIGWKEEHEILEYGFEIKLSPKKQKNSFLKNIFPFFSAR